MFALRSKLDKDATEDALFGNERVGYITSVGGLNMTIHETDPETAKLKGTKLNMLSVTNPLVFILASEEMRDGQKVIVARRVCALEDVPTEVAEQIVQLRGYEAGFLDDAKKRMARNDEIMARF